MFRCLNSAGVHLSRQSYLGPLSIDEAPLWRNLEEDRVMKGVLGKEMEEAYSGGRLDEARRDRGTETFAASGTILIIELVNGGFVWYA
ncbi:hypothetical protein PM082_024289 [Marasmius tenuissimus]|nr:hypothetical protein PM082_024289 [Marasmius tenuissimus]